MEKQVLYFDESVKDDLSPYIDEISQPVSQLELIAIYSQTGLMVSETIQDEMGRTVTITPFGSKEESMSESLNAIDGGVFPSGWYMHGKRPLTSDRVHADVLFEVGMVIQRKDKTMLVVTQSLSEEMFDAITAKSKEDLDDAIKKASVEQYETGADNLVVIQQYTINPITR